MGKICYVRVHRLVGEAFIPNPNKYPCIDHIDTNTKTIIKIIFDGVRVK